MDCPVCASSMTQENLGGVTVQACADGCKGIWFESGELAQLDETNEGVGQALQDALAAPRTNDANRADLTCPKCQISMHHHLYEGEKGVNIDECDKCGGIFLDSGELKIIREHHMSEAEESAYLQNLLEHNPAYVQGEKDLKHKEQRLKDLRHWTRFLRMSYFMTGK